MFLQFGGFIRYMYIYRHMHDFVQEATGTVYRSAQNFLHLKKKKKK